MIDEINKLLAKTKCAITVHYDMADLMIMDNEDDSELEEDQESTLKEWQNLIEQTKDTIYIQSENNKLYISIANEIYECFYIDDNGW
ncbi:MAG: hypothetical protein KU38_07895 [Sulfurovum sp. FS08-3]|nr:MAG: hypothetical protein KU38_07895 [Sulfurovum sp. FS08-3]